MSVLDCFDSVREDRPFRNGMNRDAAIRLLQTGAHSHFDPTIVDLFVQHLPEFEAQISVRGLVDQIHNSASPSPIAPPEDQVAHPRGNTSSPPYNQLLHAHTDAHPLS